LIGHAGIEFVKLDLDFSAAFPDDPVPGLIVLSGPDAAAVTTDGSQDKGYGN